MNTISIAVRDNRSVTKEIIKYLITVRLLSKLEQYRIRISSQYFNQILNAVNFFFLVKNGNYIVIGE